MTIFDNLVQTKYVFSRQSTTTLFSLYFRNLTSKFFKSYTGSEFCLIGHQCFSYIFLSPAAFRMYDPDIDQIWIYSLNNTEKIWLPNKWQLSAKLTWLRRCLSSLNQPPSPKQGSQMNGKTYEGVKGFWVRVTFWRRKPSSPGKGCKQSFSFNSFAISPQFSSTPVFRQCRTHKSPPATASLGAKQPVSQICFLAISHFKSQGRYDHFCSCATVHTHTCVHKHTQTHTHTRAHAKPLGIAMQCAYFDHPRKAFLDSLASLQAKLAAVSICSTGTSSTFWSLFFNFALDS